MSTSASPSKALRIGLWIVQILLGLAFLAIGSMKLFTPIDDLVKQGMTFASDNPWLPRFIGTSEVLGALGLILPSVTRIMPKLTVAAAAGLIAVMVLAVGYHVAIEKAPAHAAGPIVFALLLGFVLWGRAKAAPIAAR
jgi:putative oxidoreductase